MTADPRAIPADPAIHLSVVATSRNDNHGGYLTPRMQHFVNGLVEQCKRHRLRAELVLVEWNPPAGRRPLAEELVWPADCGPCDIRIVTVPAQVHEQLPHGDKLPLFQMIAKNVGIRRARGRFVLATNIDILFSNEAMLYMRDRLAEGHLYRADRLDVPTHVPEARDLDQVLGFCKNEAFRMHATGFTLLKQNGRWYPRSPLHAMLRIVWRAGLRLMWRLALRSLHYSAMAFIGVAALPFRALRATVRYMFFAEEREPQAASRPRLREILRGWRKATTETIQKGLAFVGRETRKIVWAMQWVNQALIRRELFTNACGDFTLLSRADWSALRGYPEWPMYSWHLDSILLYQANRSRIREVYLGKNAPVFHIEHEPGSGFTPESSDKLFERLDARGIPYLDWKRDVEPLINEMDKARSTSCYIQYNEANWGFADRDFPEVLIRRRHDLAGTASPFPASDALKPTASA